MHVWTVWRSFPGDTLSDCLLALNELIRSSGKKKEEGGVGGVRVFLASISNEMNRYATFALHSIFLCRSSVRAF